MIDHDMMKNEFNPGPDWEEVPMTDPRPIAGRQLRLLDEQARMLRRWQPKSHL